jgi:CHASE3 domain sensor protein
MPDRSPIAHRSWPFGFALAVPMLSLLGVGVFLHRSARILNETNNATKQVTATKAEAAYLFIAVIDNQTSQRGFIFTQDSKFLDPYERSLTMIARLRQSLAPQIVEAKARAAFARLNEVIDARLRFAATTVDLQKNGKHDESIALIMSDEGMTLTAEMREAETDLDRHFDRMTTAQGTEYTRVVMQNGRILWFVVFLDCIFGWVFIILLLRLRSNEQILRVCAWSKTVEYKGEWITFEQYLTGRFGLNVTHGISPAETKRLMSELDKSRRD